MKSLGGGNKAIDTIKSPHKRETFYEIRNIAHKKENKENIKERLFSQPHSQYILPKVKVEVSGRSMSEPVSEVALNSMIDKVYPKAPFAEPKFMVCAVLPERTFLEKVFLLHEEFAKPNELIRVERMSRHMYDIGQMLKTPIAEKAIHDKLLYRQVIEHRRTFIGLRGFDYDTLYQATLNIIPPVEVVEQWRNDYENMRLHMIYGESMPFDGLVDDLKKLNKIINSIK